MKREWVASDAHDKRDLPPDLHRRHVDICDAVSHSGYICTRLPGHIGRHAAGGGDCIYAVWGAES